MWNANMIKFVTSRMLNGEKFYVKKSKVQQTKAIII